MGTRPAATRRDDPIAEAAARARERLRHQREVALKGLDAVAAESEGDPPVAVAESDSEPIEVKPIVDPVIEDLVEEPAPGEPAGSVPTGPPDVEQAEPSGSQGDPPPEGDIAALRHEVDALRRDMQEAVAQMSRDIERAERVAAERARKEARRQGRKSERAARRAARAAMDTPEDPT